MNISVHKIYEIFIDAETDSSILKIIKEKIQNMEQDGNIHYSQAVELLVEFDPVVISFIAERLAMEKTFSTKTELITTKKNKTIFMEILLTKIEDIEYLWQKTKACLERNDIYYLWNLCKINLQIPNCKLEII